MKKLKQLSVSALFAIMFMVSCKGPEGPVGPQGSAGQAGTTGIAGVAGLPGTAGKDGNANVLQISYTAKTHSGIADLLLSFPSSLTPETVNKSLFYVYLKKKVRTSDDKEYDYWFAVPGETNVGNEYGYYLLAGNATLSSGMYLRRIVNYLNGDEAFDAIRVVVIPANESVSGGRKAPIDFKDYNQVCKAFNLPK